MKKLTPGQERYLLNLFRGEPVDGHCRTMSDHGGLHTIAYSLVRRGLVTLIGTDAPKLTAAGKTKAEWLDKLPPPEQRFDKWAGGCGYDPGYGR